jgi:HEPN domain-containing protein
MKLSPPTIAGLEKLARNRLNDATALFDAGRFDGSVYLCGYSVELALKAKICSHLGWTSLPDDISSIRTHSLEMLIRFTGLESHKNMFSDDWNLLSTWTPEMRYDAETSFGKVDAEERIDSTRRLLAVFL